MKRVLIITYYWPPSGGSGVQRWVKFAKYLPSEGWQPVIYTPENPELTSVDPSLDADIPVEAEIIKRHITEPYGLYRRLMGKGSSTDMKTLVTPISSTGRKTFRQRLSLFIRGNFFVPDPRILWVRPSVKFLTKYISEHPVDVIITTGPPQSMHLIGERLHEKTGIPWIPDFRDPWTKMYYLKHLGLTSTTWKMLHEMEQTVLDHATKVLTVTPVVQEEYQARTQTPVAMITNGYDEDDFTGKTVEHDGFFNITHTGLLASDGNPSVLWNILGEKAASDAVFRDRLRIRLVGKVDVDVLEDMKSSGLSANIADLGYLGHESAVREQLGASLLILPLRDDPEYFRILPGKLFEYLASRRPILGIGQEDGAMARVIRDCEAGTVCDFRNIDGIRAFIDAAWNSFRDGTPDVTTGDVSRYSRRSLTHSLAELLDETIS